MDKWKGSFARSQLEKFGWEAGEGLGKNKEGNAKHINVTLKNDKKGVGVNKGDWEFAWWDHLYNKSAHSVVVEKDESKGEIKVATKKKGENRRSRTGIISTHKPTGKSVITATTATSSTSSGSSMSAMADERNMMDAVKDVHANIAQRLASASLYGSFVKGSAPSSPAPSTPVSGTTSDANSEAEENHDDEEDDDDELKDYSMKVSDAELFAACEGRTARKGGRGLVDQTGKFKRVMKEFVRKTEEDENIDVGAANSDKKKKKEKKSSKKDKKAEKEKKSSKEKKADKEKKKKRKRSDDDNDDTLQKSSKKSKKSKKEAEKTESVDGKVTKVKTSKKDKMAKKDKKKKMSED